MGSPSSMSSRMTKRRETWYAFARVPAAFGAVIHSPPVRRSRSPNQCSDCACERFSSSGICRLTPTGPTSSITLQRERCDTHLTRMTVRPSLGFRSDSCIHRVSSRSACWTLVHVGTSTKASRTSTCASSTSRRSRAKRVSSTHRGSSSSSQVPHPLPLQNSRDLVH